MFRQMLRKDKMLNANETKEVLNKGEFGVLCIAGDYPYGVPVSYIYYNEAIYIHCAQKGLKIELLEKQDKVSFTVARQLGIIPEKFSVDYKSAILFGKASFVQAEEKRDVLMRLCKKYLLASVGEEEVQKELEKYFDRTAVVKITIDHMSGKKSVY